MESYKGSGGAAGMMHLWKSRDDYRPDGPFLVLSGRGHVDETGDIYVLAGESMTAIMNQMGYDAAALGNHDFDFEVSTIRARAAQAEFPFLAANIVDKRTGQPPDYAQPYTILDVNGIRVGVIGLDNSGDTDRYPAGARRWVSLQSYSEALLQYVPEMRQAGADFIFIAGHICANEMHELAPLAAELGVDVIGGGHCHQQVVEEQSGIPLVQSTSYLMGYNKVEVLVDTDADAVVESRSEFVKNKTYGNDRLVQSEVRAWRQRLPAELAEVIAFHAPPDRW